jgi:hypothetical protein
VRLGYRPGRLAYPVLIRAIASTICAASGTCRHHTIRHVYDPGLAVRQAWHHACTLPDHVPIQAFVEVIRILKKCEAALDQQQEHLEDVRAWLSEVTLKEVAGDNPSSADDEGRDYKDKYTSRANRLDGHTG